MLDHKGEERAAIAAIERISPFPDMQSTLPNNPTAPAIESDHPIPAIPARAVPTSPKARSYAATCLIGWMESPSLHEIRYLNKAKFELLNLDGSYLSEPVEMKL